MGIPQRECKHVKEQKTNCEIDHEHIVFFLFQGLRIVFNDASRLVFRMSGSGGGMGTTIRIYAESFERDPERHNRETQVQSVCVLSAGLISAVRHSFTQSTRVDIKII